MLNVRLIYVCLKGGVDSQGVILGVVGTYFVVQALGRRMLRRCIKQQLF